MPVPLLQCTVRSTPKLQQFTAAAALFIAKLKALQGFGA